MATSYQSPGVYIIEENRGPRPISGVATAVAAFVGFTKRAGKTEGSNDLLNKPQLITNWSQFVDQFGGFTQDAYLPDAVHGYFLNGGSRCYVVSVHVTESASQTAASLRIPGANKQPVFRIEAKERGSRGNDIRIAIAHAPPEPADAGAEPQDAGLFDLKISQGDVVENYPRVSAETVQVATQASKLVTITLEKPTGSLVERRPTVGEAKLAGGSSKALPQAKMLMLGDVTERAGIDGLKALDDVTMVAVPDLMMAYQVGDIDLAGVKEIQTAVLNHCESMKYRFAVLDAPSPPTSPMSPQKVETWRQEEAGFDTKFGALYYPWIEVADQTGANGKARAVPPCGHIAGIYARVDGERGVHKAPANEVVMGAVGLPVNVTKGEQDGLNPKGVNCIRSFPGRGIRVWGGRTLASDAAWRYINVRRLFNYVEASIEAGTQWVVFEPNNQDLWARVARDLRAFLRGVWRSGALFGRTPEEAFYVKVDEENNPRESRDLGILNIEIGMAPTKPAEFVVITFTQWAGPNAEA